ncbi:MAG: ABC transporter permease, partial [Leadbetterella sp.]|nr:ABC transporter permease [Leadbetterella sp.]
MIRNYFKIAWRNLWKHKTDSLINLAGLCIAFTSAILLLLSVSYEFSYDRFHTDHKDISHLYFDVRKIKGSELSSAMPAPLLPELKKAYPDIRYGVRDLNTGTVIRYRDKEISQSLKLTDADFFRLFSFPIVGGNDKDPLGNTGDVVLRKGTATAIFGDEDPVGKTIELNTSEGWKPYRVSAVAAEFPGNSSITYDVVARFETLPYYTDLLSLWDNHFHDVYIRLNENVSRETLEAKLPVFVNTHFKEDIERARRDGVQADAGGSIIQLLLQPLADMHTDTTIGSGQVNSLNRSYLYLLAAVGMVIVIIACINFINLSIGRSFTRTKEIGLRKTMGALKPQVAAQFWSEAFLVFSVAFLISGVTAGFLLPPLQAAFPVQLYGGYFKGTAGVGVYPGRLPPRNPRSRGISCLADG